METRKNISFGFSHWFHISRDNPKGQPRKNQKQTKKCINKKKVILDLLNKTLQILPKKEKAKEKKKKKAKDCPRFQAFFLSSLSPASFIALQNIQWLMQEELLSRTIALTHKIHLFHRRFWLFEMLMT